MTENVFIVILFLNKYLFPCGLLFTHDSYSQQPERPGQFLKTSAEDRKRPHKKSLFLQFNIIQFRSLRKIDGNTFKDGDYFIGF